VSVLVALAVGDLFREQLGRSAILAGADIAAIGVLNAVYEAGVRVPEDIAVAGYDNTSIAALGPISLTSVDQDGRLVGPMPPDSYSNASSQTPAVGTTVAIPHPHPTPQHRTTIRRLTNCRLSHCASSPHAVRRTPRSANRANFSQDAAHADLVGNRREGRAAPST